MIYSAIVIGSGPAGLFAASQIAKKGLSVLLVEKNNQLGKKLLISGSGQCNVTHDCEIEDFFECYGDKKKFIQKALKSYTNTDLMLFLTSRGIALDIRENKKVFPKTGDSNTILDVLVNECLKYNVNIQTNTEVDSINYEKEIYSINVKNSDVCYQAENVVVATGGITFPKTGSTGDGYVWASDFGHNIINPRSALTYVTTKEKTFADLSGISFPNTHMTIMRDGKKIIDSIGSLLITHKGLSGPLILDSSRWIDSGDKIIINTLYPNSYENVQKQFAAEIPNMGTMRIITYLTKELNLIKNFANHICMIANIEVDTPCSRITKVQRTQILQLLTKLTFEVTGLGGTAVGMVTAGGVDLKQINPTTMESRKQKGLYFIGEVLDIDGNTGGYNIQAAFSTAYLCAKHIN
ncbi:MAG: NAD(P)/FAD-dependent oxidoreductase [Cellulosilyticaceae bacterium]